VGRRRRCQGPKIWHWRWWRTAKAGFVVQERNKRCSRVPPTQSLHSIGGKMATRRARHAIKFYQGVEGLVSDPLLERAQEGSILRGL
jgi:hypothetical protein